MITLAIITPIFQSEDGGIFLSKIWISGLSLRVSGLKNDREILMPTITPQTATPVPSGSLSLPEDVKALVKQNPANSEAIYNKLIEFLMKRYPDYPDTLYTLASATAARPAVGSIVKPYIHDAFKVMADGLVLKGYDVQDKMPAMPFGQDFNVLIGQVNVLVKAYNQANGRAVPLLNTFDKLPHRDAFQLIPHWTVNYAGGKLSNVEISNNRIISYGYLQGIFASDGAFSNLRISNNRISTASPHQITIAGMLSGDISNNTDLQGNPIKTIELLPLRIGGGENVYVVSFHPSSSYQYRAITGIPLEADKRRHLRTTVANAKHYRDFRMDAFLAAYNQQTASGTLSGSARAVLAAKLAPQFGILVT
jgi:hypothetical protein